MLLIDRSNLLSDLLFFSQKGNSLVIGKPGIGKSFILKQLGQLLVKNESLCISIRIEDLLIGDDEEIENLINVKGKWIEVFSRVKLNNKYTPTLIFDGYDAARNPVLQNNILNQIKKAVTQLSEKWRIIVSVRVYDAKNSPELIKLFPSNNNDNIKSRQFYIPELNNDELSDIFTNYIQFEGISSESNNKLFNVLKTPFYLNLYYKLHDELPISETNRLTLLKSEIELLKSFWDAKIVNKEGSLKETVLFEFCELLLKNKTLRLRSVDLLKNKEEYYVRILKVLTSEGIIEEYYDNIYSLAFSHNILFDYISSKYFFNEDYKTLSDFLIADLATPFFLRPSIVYYFAELWHFKRNIFWQLYWKQSIESNENLFLVLNISINSVIVSEYNNLDELNPIISNSTNQNNNLLKLLQAIHFHRKDQLTFLDLNLLYLISKYLYVDIVWELLFLLQKFDTYSYSNDGEQIIIGLTARNSFKFLLKFENDQKYKHYISRIASSMALPLILKTYITNKEETELIIRSIISYLSKDKFEINFFSTLVRNIEYIIKNNFELAAEIALNIVFHYESSDDKTNIGSSVVMNLISNRAQDFQSVRYSLITSFSKFIESDIKKSIILFIKISNKYSQLHNYDRSKSLPVLEFQYYEKKLIFIPDYSFIWASNKPDMYDPINGLELVIEEIIKYINLDYDKFTELFNVYIQEAQSALCWHKLFKIGIREPSLTKNLFFPILTQQCFYITETVYEIGQMIELMSPMFTDNQLFILETSILSIKDNNEFFTGNNASEKTIPLLLNRLPKNRLVSSEALDTISVKPNIPNKPDFELITTLEDYSRLDNLEREGVEITTILTESLHNIEQIQAFNNTLQNSIPRDVAYKDYFETSIKIVEAIKSNNYPDKLIEEALYEVTKFCSILSRNYKILNDYEKDFVKESILYGFLYNNEKDDDSTSSPSSGYSPTVRTESVEGLLLTYIEFKDSVSLHLFNIALKSESAVVRFGAYKYLIRLSIVDFELYSTILEDAILLEEDSFNLSVLLSCINFNLIEESKLLKIIDFYNEKISLSKQRGSFLESLINILLYILKEVNEEYALKFIYNNVSDDSFKRNLIYSIFKTIDHNNKEDISFDKEFNNNVINILNDIVNQEIYIIRSFPTFDANDNTVHESLSCLDSIISNLYFSLTKAEEKNVSRSQEFYYFIKPVLNNFFLLSSKVSTNGYIVGHSAYYLMKVFNICLEYDNEYILNLTNKLIKYSHQSGYTFDSTAIEEIVRFTESILSDHKYLLLDTNHLNEVVEILNLFVKSGWNQALELVWRLDEVFR